MTPQSGIGQACDIPSTALGSPALQRFATGIDSRAAGENFPVAMRWLPGTLRSDLSALYGFARLVDEIGDAPDGMPRADGGDPLALLDALSCDVARIETSEPEHPIVRRLAGVVRKHALPIEALERLIEANRRDRGFVQMVTWDDLVDTCTRSANPVGELVLGLFAARTPKNLAASDAICTALQLVEHCQDVLEDRARGRVYLPFEDLAHFGCRDLEFGDETPARPGLPTRRRDSSWAAPRVATPALRDTIGLQVARARTLLAQTGPLLVELRGLAMPLVAGYAAGGLATCDALERCGYDVIAHDARPARRDWWKHWLSLCLRARLGRRSR